MSKEHVKVRARTPCRLAVLARDRLDNDALLGVATEQTSQLEAYRDNLANAGPRANRAGPGGTA